MSICLPKNLDEKFSTLFLFGEYLTNPFSEANHKLPALSSCTENSTSLRSPLAVVNGVNRRLSPSMRSTLQNPPPYVHTYMESALVKYASNTSL